MTTKISQATTTEIAVDDLHSATAQRRDELESPESGSDFEGNDEGVLNASSSRISLEKNDRSLWEFKRWHDDNDLVLDPEWQRNYVWSNPQASKLIESFLLNIPVPVVYLSRTQDQRYTVIDGLQRLTSVFNFFADKYKLTGLNIRRELNGKKFSDLDKASQRELKNATLRSFELSSNTDSDIHFIVFERLNTGGTKLNETEIRNCIFKGSTNTLLKELSSNKDFVKCVNQSTLQKRMNDRNLVLRFLAFYERTHLKCGHGLKKFLNEFLETHRNPSDKKLAEFKNVFERCMKASLTVFGDNGFRLRNDPKKGSQSTEWATRVNSSVFQCVSTSFADYSLSQITGMADRIYEEYLDLITHDKHWIDYVRRATGEKARLTYVFETWRDRLKKLLSNDLQSDTDKRIFSRQLKKEMFEQNAVCKICGNEIRLMEDAALDHDEHYWRGGATIPENARLVHRYCNLSRGGKN